MYVSHINLVYVTLLWTLVWIPESKQQEGDFVSRYFQMVSQVNITSQVDAWTEWAEGVSSELECASLCVEYGCECASFSYDSRNGTCHMFTKSLIGDSGSDVGANKITECSVPTVFTNATLLYYTGCNATYECDFGYSSLVPGTLTCQANETWLPSAFECLEIRTPINIQYTVQWTTANEDYAGTGAQVYVTVHGIYGSTTINLPLNKNYNLGTSDEYCTTTEDVGPLLEVEVWHDGTGPNPGWKLESITIIMQGVGTYIMDTNVWIEDEDSKVTLIP